MPTLIPFIPSNGRYRFDTVIENKQYAFEVQWNTLEAAWYFNLLDYDATPIATGVKIVLNTYLARTYNHPLLLDGVFLARSSALVPRDPLYDDLGVTVRVYYFTRADMVAQILAVDTGSPQ